MGVGLSTGGVVKGEWGRHPPDPEVDHPEPEADTADPKVDTPLDPEADTPLDPEADTPPPARGSHSYPPPHPPPPLETATEAGGTHPTGMHSCWHVVLEGARGLFTYILTNVQLLYIVLLCSGTTQTTVLCS